MEGSLMPIVGSRCEREPLPWRGWGVRVDPALPSTHRLSDTSLFRVSGRSGHEPASGFLSPLPGLLFHGMPVGPASLPSVLCSEGDFSDGPV